jgi:hypothetical protein
MFFDWRGGNVGLQLKCWTTLPRYYSDLREGVFALDLGEAAVGNSGERTATTCRELSILTLFRTSTRFAFSTGSAANELR